MSTLPAAASLVLALAACGGDSASGPPDTPAPVASITVSSGNDQVGEVGAELPAPLVVRLTDSTGNVIAGQGVTFVVTAGGGRVFAGFSVSSSDGLVQERWTLGNIATDSQRVEVRAVDNATGAPRVFATFRATAEPGPPTALAVVAPAPTTVIVQDTARAHVVATDRFGNSVPEAGLALEWSSSNAGIVSVDDAGLLTGHSSGEAEIEASTGEISTSFRVTADPFGYTTHAVDGPVSALRAAGGRFLALGTVVRGGASVGTTWRWTGSEWIDEYEFPEGVGHLWITAAGQAWAAGSSALWSSPSAGNWQVEPVPAPLTTVHHLAGSGDDVFLGGMEHSTASPIPHVVRHRGGTWQNLSLPTDAATGLTDAKVHVLPRTPDDAYVVITGLGYKWATAPLRVLAGNGASWAAPSPDGVSGLEGTLGSWAAPTGGSPLRALVSVNGTQPGTNYTLGAFTGGAATIAAKPADAADFDRIAHGPGTVPWLLGASHLAWPTDGAWRLHELRDGWSPTGGFWIDDEGAAWVGVRRPLAGGGQEYAVLVIRNLDP